MSTRFLVSFTFLVSILVLAACNNGSTADAGPDGAMSDGGHPDTGTPDTGTPDTGTPDTGTPDTGTPDGGMPDTGTPDLGPPPPHVTMALVPATYSSVRVATYDAVSGAVTTAPADLDDGASPATATHDAVPVFLGGDTSGMLIRDVGQLAILGADGVTPERRIPTDDVGDVAPYGSNPQAVAAVSATKAYVTRLTKNSVLVVDPSMTGAAAQLGTIDLSGFMAAGDVDGTVDMSAVVVIGSHAYVALGRYFFDPGTFAITYPAGSVVAVIDTATDTVVDTDATAPGVQGIALSLNGPVALASFGGDLYVASNGAYGATDGGIERVGLTAFTLTTICTEADLTPASASPGDLSGLVATPTMLVAIAADRAMVVNPTSGAVGAPLVGADVMGLVPAGGEHVVVGLRSHMTVYDVMSATDVTPAATPVMFDMSLMVGAMSGG